jgi:hypothetical protein
VALTAAISLIPLERPDELCDRIAAFRDTIIGS